MPLKNKEIQLSIYEHDNGNRYLKTNSGIWVRDFTRKSISPVDINKLISDSEIKDFVDSEFKSTFTKSHVFDNNLIKSKTAVIFSNGSNMIKNYEILNSLNKNFYLICVNNTVRYWDLKKSPNLFVINNPYQDCLSLINKNVMPVCLASSRTYNGFFENYGNVIVRYNPTPQEDYHAPTTKNVDLFLDDYRNPVCSAIHFCFINGVENIILIGCTDGYKDNKSGSIKIGEHYKYPPQVISDEIIDGMMFWYKKNNPNAGLYNFGIEDSFIFSKNLGEELIKKLS